MTFRKRGFEYIREEEIPLKLPKEFPRTNHSNRIHIKKVNFIWWVYTKEIVKSPYYVRLRKGCTDDNVYENLEKVTKFNTSSLSPQKKKEFYENLSKKLKGKLMHPITNEMRKKISLANKGKIMSEETKHKLSISIKKAIKEGRLKVRYGEENPSWKGGQLILGQYYYIKEGIVKKKYPNLPKDFPILSSKRKKDNYIKRANLVWWKHTGEIIKYPEFAHHKNRNKTDDRFENLEKTNRSEHAKKHAKEYLEKRKQKLDY